MVIERGKAQEEKEKAKVLVSQIYVNIFVKCKHNKYSYLVALLNDRRAGGQNSVVGGCLSTYSPTVFPLHGIIVQDKCILEVYLLSNRT